MKSFEGPWAGVALRAMYFILGVAVSIAVLLLLAVNAQAGTIKGNPDQCMWAAQVSAQMAAAREEGMPWEVAIVDINDKIAEAMGVKDSLIQDEEDATFIRQMAYKVWHEWKAKDPRTTGMDVLLDCTKKLMPTRHTL